MYKMLVIDDELIIRKGITDCYDWKSLGFDSVIEAENGAQALEIVKEKVPDVILTDIRMPGCDGLLLAEKVKEISPNTVIIIMSGYNEFEYARKAMKIGIKEFLVKPTKVQDIVNSVKNALYEIEMSRNMNKKVTKTLLNDLINSDAADCEKLLGKVRLNVKESPFTIAVFSYSQYENSDWHRLRDKVLICYGIMNILEEFFTDYRKEIFEDNMGNVALLVSLGVTADKFVKQVEDVRLQIEEALNIIVRAGIGEAVDSLSDIRTSYLEAVGKMSGDASKEPEDKQTLDSVLNVAKKYIDDNLACDISLNTVSKYVNMNPSYFSRFFHNRTGIKFSTYVEHIRIDKAKKLLKDPDIKAYEVAELVGYSNAHYFGQLFKKYTGQTISEYRKQFLD